MWWDFRDEQIHKRRLYYLTQFATRAPDRSPELLPELLLSASTCICDFFPDNRAIDWVSASAEEQTRKAAKPGIAATALPEIMEWATDSVFKEFGWSNAFYSLDAAQTARTRFFPERTDLVIVGWGCMSLTQQSSWQRRNPPRPRRVLPLPVRPVFVNASAAGKL